MLNKSLYTKYYCQTVKHTWSGRGHIQIVYHSDYFQ